jgi:hypothetical protein
MVPTGERDLVMTARAANNEVAETDLAIPNMETVWRIKSEIPVLSCANVQAATSPHY